MDKYDLRLIGCQKKTCEELGFQFVLTLVGSAIDPSLAAGDGVEDAIIEANEDDTVDGIMVFMDINVTAKLSHSHIPGLLSDIRWATGQWLP